jgi:hypothetical protein
MHAKPQKSTLGQLYRKYIFKSLSQIEQTVWNIRRYAHAGGTKERDDLLNVSLWYGHGET